MGIPHDHLECSVPEQLCDGAQIHFGHNKSPGKCMAVAMPAMGIDLRLFERGGKPSARPLEEIPGADEREDGVDSRPSFPALTSKASQFIQRKKLMKLLRESIRYVNAANWTSWIHSTAASSDHNILPAMDLIGGRSRIACKGKGCFP